MSQSLPWTHPLRTRTPAPRRSPKAFFVGVLGGALLAGLAGYGIGGGALLTEPAAAGPVAAAPAALADPPCGFDPHRRTVDVVSLGAHGTARVTVWRHGIGTLVGTAHLKRGRTVTVKLDRKVTPSRVRVDVVRGRLTVDEGTARVWECEPA